MSRSNDRGVSSDLFGGIKWSVYEVYGGQFISLLISIILARILTPADFGLIGITLGVFSLTKSFISLGFTEAIIQNQTTSPSALNSIFILNLLMGILISILFFFLSPSIAAYFGNKELEPIIKLLSIGNILESFVKVQTALFSKKMDFKTLAIRKLTSQLISGTVAVYLALKGFGIYALAVQFLLGVMISSVLIWIQSSWRPRMQFSLNELQLLRPVAQFSLATGLLNRASKELFTFTIAKYTSLTQLGYYSKANSNVDFLINGVAASINKFLFPMLSSIQIDNREFKQRFINVYHFSLIIVLLLSSVCFVSADSIITTLLGNQWTESVFIFKCLLIRGVTATHYSVVKSAILAKSKLREGYIYDNLRRVVELSSLIGLVFGGFNYFLFWFIAAQSINLFIQCILVNKAIGYSYSELMSFLTFNLIFTAAGALYIDNRIDGFDSFIIQDLIKALFVFILIVIKLFIFDLRLLKEVTKSAITFIRTRH
jgi:O-antigen/teichoic acid export membrane protein